MRPGASITCPHLVVVDGLPGLSPVCGPVQRAHVCPYQPEVTVGTPAAHKQGPAQRCTSSVADSLTSAAFQPSINQHACTEGIHSAWPSNSANQHTSNTQLSWPAQLQQQLHRAFDCNAATHIDRLLIAPPPPMPIGSYCLSPYVYTAAGPSTDVMLQEAAGGTGPGPEGVGGGGAGFGEGDGRGGGAGTSTKLL